MMILKQTGLNRTRNTSKIAEKAKKMTKKVVF